MKAWTAVKVGIFIGMTVAMLFHWQVVESDAYCREKAPEMPWAIVPGEALATPSGAERAPMVEPVPSGHWENAGRHRMTHYCSCRKCNGSNAGRTASGAPMTVGRTVATGREFPFGTRLLINGQTYVVEDRGVPNGCVDILVDSHSEAYRRGVFRSDIYVWRED